MSGSIAYTCWGPAGLYKSFVEEAMKKEQDEVWARLFVSPGESRIGQLLEAAERDRYLYVDPRNLNLNPSKLSLAIAATIR